MRYYPAFLKLHGKSVLVVGGGPIACQKTRTFLRCGAKVTVVATQWTARFPRPVIRKKRAFRAKDLKGVVLVCAATDKEHLNARIARGCRQKRIWVNVVDRPRLCDFIVPSVVAKDPVAVAISTGGSSPALAKVLRQKMESWLKPEVASLAKWLESQRGLLKTMTIAKRRKVLSKVIRDDVFAKLRRDKAKTLKNLTHWMKSKQ